MGSSRSPSPSPDPAADPAADPEAAAMAAAMGFSSFGAPPSKKRRFNPRADAAITPTTLAAAPSSLPPKPPAPLRHRGGATGANQLPLHQRGAGAGAVVGTPVAEAGVGAQGTDEIDLGSDGAGEDEAAQEVRGSRNGGSTGGDNDDDGDENPVPQYIDTSRPPAQGAPRGRGRGRGGGHGGGPPGRAWSTDYYDPSSNENPWQKLEASRGLEPVGSWLTRGSGRSG